MPPLLTDVYAAMASGHRCFLRGLKIPGHSTPLQTGDGAHQDYEKNRRVAEPLFLTFSSPLAAIFCGNIRAVRLYSARRNHATAPTAGSSTSPLGRFARCARVIPRSRSTSGLAHLGKGAFRPRCIPRPGALLRGPHQTRFAFWTSDRGDFISPWTLDHGGLRARPGPPDQGSLRAPSGHPSTRLSQPWTAPKGVAPWHPLLLFLFAPPSARL